MAFHTADYDVYVFIGDPATQPLWHWDKWLLLMSDLDALLHVARGPASTRSTQFLPNRGGTVKFGKIGWKEPDQQKWTHGSPRTLESSPSWRFLDWSAAHKVSDNRMATVRGDVAGDDWDDFGVGALGLHTKGLS